MRADPVRAARVHRRRTALACLGTVIVVAVAVSAVMVLRDNGSPAANGQPAVAHGGSFPDVTVEDADGVTITTSSLTGKPTLVWFSDRFGLVARRWVDSGTGSWVLAAGIVAAAGLVLRWLWRWARTKPTTRDAECDCAGIDHSVGS